MSNNPFLQRLEEQSPANVPEETLENRQEIFSLDAIKAARLRQKEEEKLDRIDPFGFEFLDADTLRNPETGERFRVAPASPGRTANTYETSPEAYQGIGGRKRFEAHADAYEREYGVRPSVQDLVREGQSAARQVREQYPIEDITVTDTGETDIYDRKLVTVGSEKQGDLGTQLATRDRNAAYNLPENISQRTKDIGSGNLLARRIGSGPKSRSQYMSDWLGQVKNAFVKTGADLVGESIRLSPVMPVLDWLAQKGHNLVVPENEKDTGDSKNFIGREFGIGQAINEGIEQWSKDNLSIEELKIEQNYRRRQQRQEQLFEEEKQEKIDNGMSPTKAELEKQGAMFKYTLGQMRRDPSRAMNALAQTAPDLVGSVGVAAVRAGFVFKKLAKKYGKDWKSNPEAVKEATKDLGTTAILADTTFEAVSASAEARDQVLNLSEEELKKSPLYNIYLEEGKSPEEAKFLLADNVAAANLVTAGAITAVTNKIIGLGDVLGRVAGGLRTPQAASGNIAKTVSERFRDLGATTARETVQEGVETPSQLAGSNLITQQLVDPEQGITEGTGAATAEGVVAGGLAGGTVAGASTGMSAVQDAVTLGKGTEVPDTPEAKEIVTGIKAAVKNNELPPIAEAYLTAIADIESKFNPGAVGPRIGIDIDGDPVHYGKRARGPFQFMPSTAEQYGLNNPHDPTASANAAAKLLQANFNTIRKAKPKWSDEKVWAAAALAHHSGAGNVIKGRLGKHGRNYRQMLEARIGGGLRKAFAKGKTNNIRKATNKEVFGYAESRTEEGASKKPITKAAKDPEERAKELNSSEDMSIEEFKEFEINVGEAKINIHKAAREAKEAGDEAALVELRERYRALNDALESRKAEFLASPTLESINNLKGKTLGSGEDIETSDNIDDNLSAATVGLANGVGENISLDNIDAAVQKVLEAAKKIPGISESQLKVTEDKLGGFKSTGPGRIGTRGLLHYRDQIIGYGAATNNKDGRLVPRSPGFKVKQMDRALTNLASFIDGQLNKEVDQGGANEGLDALRQEENSFLYEAFNTLRDYRDSWAELHNQRQAENSKDYRDTGNSFEYYAGGKAVREGTVRTQKAPLPENLKTAAEENQAKEAAKASARSPARSQTGSQRGSPPRSQTASAPSAEAAPTTPTPPANKPPEGDSEPSRREPSRAEKRANDMLTVTDKALNNSKPSELGWLVATATDLANELEKEGKTELQDKVTKLKEKAEKIALDKEEKIAKASESSPKPSEKGDENLTQEEAEKKYPGILPWETIKEYKERKNIKSSKDNTEEVREIAGYKITFVPANSPKLKLSNGKGYSLAKSTKNGIIIQKGITVPEVLKYLSGHGTNSSDAARQKEVVTKRMLNKHGVDLIKTIKGMNDQKLRLFVIYHEISHVENNDMGSGNYYSNKNQTIANQFGLGDINNKYLSDSAVQIETRANMSALKKLGLWKPTSKQPEPKKPEPEQVELEDPEKAKELSTKIFQSDWKKSDIKENTKEGRFLFTPNFNKVIKVAKDKVKSLVATLPNLHLYLKSKDEVNKLLDKPISEEEFKALQEFNDFRDKVEKALTKLLKGIDPKNTFAYQAFNESPYNYLRSKEEGNPLNSNTVTAIASSLYDYMAVMSKGTAFNNDEEIADILGKQLYDVTDEDRNEIRFRGNLRKNVVDSLGSAVWKQHNLKITGEDALLPNRMKTSLGLLALEVGIDLGLLEPEGKKDKPLTVEKFLSLSERDIQDIAEGTNVPFVRVATTEENKVTENVQSIIDNFVNFKDVAKNIFDISDEPRDIQLEEPDEVNTNIRGSINKAPEQLTELLKEFQKEKYIPDPSLKTLIESIPRQEFMETVMGWKDPETVQQHFRDSQEGKNLQIEYAYTDLVNHFKKHGSNPAYFTYSTKTNTRTMIDSNTVNYHASKLHRAFMVNANWKVTVPLDGSNPDLLDAFKLAVGLWLGVKTDKKVVDQKLIEEIDAKLEGPKIKAAWQMLLSKEKGSQYSEEDLAVLKPVLDAEEGPETLAALRAWADYTKALNSGEKAFETYLSDEVDGLTNGLAITLLQIPSGSGDAIKELLSKVGIFSKEFTQSGIDSFAKIKNNVPGFLDNYEELALVVNRFINDFSDSNEVSKTLREADNSSIPQKEIDQLKQKIVRRALAGLRIKKLLPELYDEETGTVSKPGRDFSKDPVMQGNYGAGEGALKRGVENLAIDKFYEDISKIAENPELPIQDKHSQIKDKLAGIEFAVANFSQAEVKAYGLTKDANRVANSGLNINLQNIKLEDSNQKLIEQIREYKLPEEVVSKLQWRTRETFGQAAWDGLNEILGPQFATRDLIVKALYIMNVVYVSEFNKIRNNLEKVKDRKLTNDEILRIKKDLNSIGLLPSFRTAGSTSNIDFKQMLEVTSESLELEKGDRGKARAGLKTGDKTQQVQRHMPNADIGMKGYVRAIQAIDSYVIAKIFEGESVQHIFDAFKGSFKDVARIAEKADRVFMEVNQDYSLVEAIDERVKVFLDKIEEDLDLQVLIDDSLGGSARNSNDPTSLEEFIGSWDTTVEDVKRNRAVLFADIGASNQFNRDGTAYQVSDRDSTAYQLTDIDLDEFIDALGSSSDEFYRNWFDEKFTGNLTSETVKNIYDNVISQLDQQDISPEHAEHLNRILKDFIIPGLENVDILQLNVGVGQQVSNNVGRIQGNEIFLGAAGNKITNPQRMSLRETAVHEYVHAISKNFLEDPENYWAVKQLERLFNRAKETITVEDFIVRDEEGVVLGDPDAAREAAQKRYDYIFNNTEGNHLHEFLAIGLTNDPFRKKLNQIDLKPAKGEESVENIFSWNPLQLLWNIFNRAIQWFNTRTYESVGIAERIQRGSGKLSENLEALTTQLIAVSAKQAESARESALEKAWRTTQERANEYVSEKAGDVAEAAVAALAKKDVRPTLKAPKQERRSIQVGVIRDVIEKTGQNLQDQIEGWYKQTKDIKQDADVTLFNPVKDLWSEIAGLSQKDRKDWRVWKRMSMRHIDQQRQRIKDSVTAMVSEAFDPKKPLREREWEALTAVGLKTDMVTLTKKYTMNQILEMVRDSQELDGNIRELTRIIKNRFGVNGNAYVNQATGLGILMATGKGTVGIERQQLNAHNIANMYFLDADERPTLNNVTEAEELVDELASLVALNHTDDKYKQAFLKVADHETSRNITNNGIEVMLSTALAHKNMALERNFDNNKISTVKGYVKENYDPDISMEVRPTDPLTKSRMENEGWKLVGSVEKDEEHAKLDNTKLGIYIMGIGLPAYRKSVIGLEDQKVKGADLETAFADSVAAFLTKDEQRMAIAEIDRWLKAKAKKIFRDDLDLTPKTGKLIPVLSPTKDGKTVNYRYMMNEESKVSLLKKQDLAHDVLGSMMGAISEKETTKTINKSVIQHMAEEYNNLRDEDFVSFVNISPYSPDPKRREQWKMLPADTRREAEKAFGAKHIMLRKDMVDYAFGFRDVSLTRLAIPQLNKVLGKANLKVPGHIATSVHLLDKIFKEMVGFVRVRNSLLLPNVAIGNMVSNVLLLTADGIPPWYILKKGAEGAAAIREYTKISQEIEQLKVALVGARNQNKPTKQIEGRLSFLERKQENSPVHELAEEALIQTIVEDVNPDTLKNPFSASTGAKKVGELRDKGLRRLGVNPERVKEAEETNQLVRGGSTALRNILMLPGSSTFSTAITMNQMADAVSRYVKYSYDTKVKKKRKIDAINDALDYFIFYDEPSSRWVNTLNDYGFWMFSRFFLRIQKVVLRLYGQKPANMIMQGMLENTFGEADTVDDYFFNTSKLGYNTSLTPQVELEDFTAIPSLEWLKTFTP